MDKIDNLLIDSKVKFKLKSRNTSKKDTSVIYEINLNNNNDIVEQILKFNDIIDVNLLSQDGESQY